MNVIRNLLGDHSDLERLHAMEIARMIAKNRVWWEQQKRLSREKYPELYRRKPKPKISDRT